LKSLNWIQFKWFKLVTKVIFFSIILVGTNKKKEKKCCKNNIFERNRYNKEYIEMSYKICKSKKYIKKLYPTNK
jgi:hypothetical protein